MKELIIIDGHNVIHALDRYRRLTAEEMGRATDELISDAVNLAPRIGKQVIIVFDGRGEGSSVDQTELVRVVYSRGAESADHVIERLVFDEAPRRSVLVCTADYQQQKVVWRRGVKRMSPREFENMIREADEEQGEAAPRRKTRLTLEERLPDSVRRGLEELRDRSD